MTAIGFVLVALGWLFALSASRWITSDWRDYTAGGLILVGRILFGAGVATWLWWVAP